MAKQGFKISRDSCVAQLGGLLKAQKLLKYLLQENVNDENSWKTQLTPLLCEYYTGVKQQVQFYLEVLLSTSVSAGEEKEEIMISEEQASILTSLNMLLHLSESDLKFKHRISLTLH